MGKATWSFSETQCNAMKHIFLLLTVRIGPEHSPCPFLFALIAVTPSVQPARMFEPIPSLHFKNNKQQTNSMV
jgi:hypothetical protein